MSKAGITALSSAKALALALTAILLTCVFVFRSRQPCTYPDYTLAYVRHSLCAVLWLGGSCAVSCNAASCAQFNAGSLEIEVSSGIRPDICKPHVPTRFAARASAGDNAEGTSSLQALAAAADSGESLQWRMLFLAH